MAGLDPAMVKLKVLAKKETGPSANGARLLVRDV
jgi:hypothetical protein